MILNWMDWFLVVFVCFLVGEMSLSPGVNHQYVPGSNSFDGVLLFVGSQRRCRREYVYNKQSNGTTDVRINVYIWQIPTYLTPKALKKR